MICDTKFKLNIILSLLCLDVILLSKVEVKTSKELLLEPVTIARSEYEKCLIESSINSVRVSIKFKHADPIEQVLGRKYLGFLMRRAEDFIIMRRVPVKVS